MTSVAFKSKTGILQLTNGLSSGMQEILNSNETRYRLPTARSIYELLKTRAEKHAGAVAVVAPDRRALTYAGLLNQTENTVRALRAFGLNSNDKVAVVLPNGAEMAVAFVAVAAGATCAPLNP